jgi:hypothetical protein
MLRSPAPVKKCSIGRTGITSGYQHVLMDYAAHITLLYERSLLLSTTPLMPEAVVPMAEACMTAGKGKAFQKSAWGNIKGY